VINDLISNISFFGIFLTGMIYIIAIVLQSKLKSSLLNPLMISCIIIIVLLLVTGIDYDVYMFGKVKPDGTYDGTGAAFFQNMLTPTTVCLAIPLYEKFVQLIRDKGIHVETGEFGAEMMVESINDGPLTLIVDTNDLNI